jgi:hypothetical protein
MNKSCQQFEELSVVEQASRIAMPGVSSRIALAGIGARTFSAANLERRSGAAVEAI